MSNDDCRLSNCAVSIDIRQSTIPFDGGEYRKLLFQMLKSEIMGVSAPDEFSVAVAAAND